MSVPKRRPAFLPISALAAALAPAAPALADQVILEDLIVDGSICAGVNCEENEDFGFAVLRLKENNLQIDFDDTSATGGDFALNDWRIVVNDTVRDGAGFFRIEDVTGGLMPFTLEAGAPSHALYVKASGDVGIGTDLPVVKLHVKDGDTPTLRLEQDGSAGFSPRTWDIGGNDASFFIRDQTGGTHPLVIRPGAPSNSLYIDNDGHVGVGDFGDVGSTLFDLDPHFEVRKKETFTYFRLTATEAPENQSVDVVFTQGPLTTGELRYNIVDGDGPEMRLDADGKLSLSKGSSWYVGLAENFGDMVFYARIAAPQMTLHDYGDLTLHRGTLIQNSDRNNKTAINPVDPAAILARVAALDVSEWSYRDDTGVRHIGPMAQDFHALFGTGASETGISTLDTSGVALAAIQALAAENAALKARLDRLEARAD